MKIGAYTLRDYQERGHVAALEHLREQVAQYRKDGTQPKPVILDYSVGSGKTILIGGMAAHCHERNIRVLILARQEELVEQDAEDARAMGANVSYYTADTKSTFYNIIAGTEGSVCNALGGDFAEWLPSLVLVDEGHMVSWQDVLERGSSQYSQIINHFNDLADLHGKMRPAIIGYTGTPYRGIESIVGPYWDKCIASCQMPELVERHFLVPTVFGFGHDGAKYDLDEAAGDPVEHGTGDYTESQREAMYAAMTESQTAMIMREVVEIMESRNLAMITCAGRKHCEEAASYLPKGTWGIITQDTPKKERRETLDKAKDGRIKYLLQVGALTTGLNRPLIDTSVLLRRIGSLTLLVQLLGRGMRLLKPEHEEAGFIKSDHLCLDYAGTMATMASMFNDPMLEDAQLAEAKEAGEIIHCPKCGTENSEHARRCIGHSAESQDGRCEFFFKSRECEDHKRGDYLIKKGCGAENDIAARECRICGNTLIDPNEKLARTHYRDSDWKPVLSMELEVVGKGNGQGIAAIYHLDNVDELGNHEVARVEYFAIRGGGKQAFRSNFVNRHINGYAWQSKVMNMSPVEIVNMKAMFATPTSITHRVNEKGKSVVHGIRKSDGAEFKGSKRSG